MNRRCGPFAPAEPWWLIEHALCVRTRRAGGRQDGDSKWRRRRPRLPARVLLRTVQPSRRLRWAGCGTRATSRRVGGGWVACWQGTRTTWGMLRVFRAAHHFGLGGARRAGGAGGPRALRRVRRDLIVLAASLAVFAVCAVIVADGRVSPAERAVFHAINGLPGWLYRPMLAAQFLGVLGMPLIIAAGALGVAALAAGRRAGAGGALEAGAGAGGQAAGAAAAAGDDGA